MVCLFASLRGRSVQGSISRVRPWEKAERSHCFMFGDHSQCRVKVRTHKQFMQPRGQTFGGVQNWCHVKGHELWLEASSWSASLKARLKGHRGWDSFWSTATKGARTNENTMFVIRSEGILWEQKPLKLYTGPCCASEWPWGARTPPTPILQRCEIQCTCFGNVVLALPVRRDMLRGLLSRRRDKQMCTMCCMPSKHE